MKKNIQKVKIESIDLSFWSILVLLVKVVLASIPAMIVATIIVIFAISFFSGFLEAM